METEFFLKNVTRAWYLREASITSKHGNFLCKYDGKDLFVTRIDGTTTVFHDLSSRYNEAFKQLYL